MEKIILQVEPTLNDYYHVARSFQTRKRAYWVSLGVYSVGALCMLIVAILSLWIESLRFSFYLMFVFLVLLFFTSYPFWSGWLILRNASKKEQLIMPVRYELDDENITVANQIAEGKYDWSAFDKAFEDEQYFFISYSTNKQMFQFIPKRTFTSAEQKRTTHELIVRHLGEIEHTQKGLTGWKLAGLTASLFFVFLLCVVAVTAIATALL